MAELGVGADPAHGASFMALPGVVLLTHMAGGVFGGLFGGVKVMRPLCKDMRAVAAHLVAQKAQSASLGESDVSEADAWALGAALASATYQCDESKRLRITIANGKYAHVLQGMHDSNASMHAAELCLSAWDMQSLCGLASWPNLATLEVTRAKIQPGVGSGLATLTQLRSLGLVLLASDQAGHLGVDTLHGSHLQQLSQLTSLSLTLPETDPGAAEFVRSLERLTQLQALRLGDGVDDAGNVTSAWASALPALTALTSLDAGCLNSSEYADIEPNAATALVNGIAKLSGLQHLGLPNFIIIDKCAPQLSTLTGLRSLRICYLDIIQEQEAAPLLSQLTRLQLSVWDTFPKDPGFWPSNRASWLAQLQEVSVDSVNLPVLADLPPGVRINPSPSSNPSAFQPAASLDISCTATSHPQAATQVGKAVALLRDNPTVWNGHSSLFMGEVRQYYVAALKPLAEAAGHVWGLDPGIVPHMAGWQLKRLGIVLSSPSLPQLAQATVGVGLRVESLYIKWGGDTFSRVVKPSMGTRNAVQMMCEGLHGLRFLLLHRGNLRHPDALVAAEWEKADQELFQWLQGLVQGRDVHVKYAN